LKQHKEFNTITDKQWDKGDKTPFLMSAENEMDPGELPAHLPELSQVEEMVIARSHV